MKQLNTVIATMLVAVFATALQAQTNEVAAVSEQTWFLQGTNSDVSCVKDEKAPPTKEHVKRAAEEFWKELKKA